MSINRRFSTSLGCLLALAFFTSAVMAADAAETAEAQALPRAFDAGWQGEKTCELLYESPEVRVGRCSFPPGIGHEKHVHSPHFGYVLEGGTLRIVDAAGQVEVRDTRAGTSWSTTSIIIHEALNIGDTTASYLIVEPVPVEKDGR